MNLPSAQSRSHSNEDRTAHSCAIPVWIDKSKLRKELWKPPLNGISKLGFFSIRQGIGLGHLLPDFLRMRAAGLRSSSHCRYARIVPSPTTTASPPT